MTGQGSPAAEPPPQEILGLHGHGLCCAFRLGLSGMRGMPPTECPFDSTECLSLSVGILAGHIEMKK